MKMRNALITIMALGGLGYGAYRYLLTDEARENAKTTLVQLSSYWDGIAAKINQNLGESLDSELLDQRRSEISEAWRAIGF